MRLWGYLGSKELAERRKQGSHEEWEAESLHPRLRRPGTGKGAPKQHDLVRAVAEIFFHAVLYDFVCYFHREKHGRREEPLDGRCSSTGYCISFREI